MPPGCAYGRAHRGHPVEDHDDEVVGRREDAEEGAARVGGSSEDSDGHSVVLKDVPTEVILSRTVSGLVEDTEDRTARVGAWGEHPDGRQAGFQSQH